MCVKYIPMYTRRQVMRYDTRIPIPTEKYLERITCCVIIVIIITITAALKRTRPTCDKVDERRSLSLCAAARSDMAALPIDTS